MKSRDEVYKANFLVTLAFFYFFSVLLTNLGGFHYVPSSQLLVSGFGLLCTLSVPFIVKYIRRLNVGCLVFVGGNFLATCASVFLSTGGVINFFTGIWFVVQYLTAYLVCGRKRALQYLTALFGFILFVVWANLTMDAHVVLELPYTAEQQLLGMPFILGIGLLFLHYLTSQFVNSETRLATELKHTLDERDTLVSTLNKKQLELQHAKQGAESAAKSMSEFLSTMSHEIRTPLNAVVGISHLLLEDQPAPNQTENLNILKFSAETLLALVNDILDFNKIEAGKIELEQTAFDLSLLLDSIQKAHTVQAQQKNTVLEFAIDEKVPKNLKGDPTRLAQILHNLVGNAVKFTEQGRVAVRVTCLSTQDSTVVVQFTVSDTGIGIPSDKLETIFDSFTQANADTARQYGGTGLGLAITKRLIGLQGGKINVKSEEYLGSTFYVDLPFFLIPAWEEPPKPTVLQKQETAIAKGKRILMVEDNAINVLIARKHLAKLGVELEVAHNGEEAVMMAKSRPFDLILMDLQMPVMNGFEATRRIRTWDTTLPIVGLTASVEDEIQKKMQQAGINDWVFKPIEPNVLREALLKHLSEAATT